LSEESANDQYDIYQLAHGEWLIVDPLDGSNNHALEMPNYGYMASYIQSGKLSGAVVVLPEHNQYIIYENEKSLYSRPLMQYGLNKHGTIYYAYPPNQNEKALLARAELFNLIDNNSGGLYRYGSACIALYHLLCGKHTAFIAHGIRLWDAIAFMPILKKEDFEVMYKIEGQTITLLASKELFFLKQAELILQKHQNLNLHHLHDGILKFN
jgi:fructose-1,6-bisphosphatase/inositol monophosphatase family enzyme